MGCKQTKTSAHLEQLSLEKANMPVYIPPLKNVGVIDVYDGDTITIAVKQSHGYYKYKVRLAGIDSPEIRTNNPREKAAAVQSREFLKSIILYKYVSIEGAFYEKYGRLCGTVLLDGKNINEQMIAQGFAVRYTGGKKPEFNK